MTKFLNVIKQKIYRKQSGFTLIEISIVLVIIGILIAGTLTGQHLLHQTRLNSVIVDIENIKIATNLFEEKYYALPGDMPDAASLWASTANGDGDTQVETSGEDLRAWQQLVLANMLSGAYTGSGTLALETNIFPSKIDKGGYRLIYGTNYSKAGNYIEFGAINTGIGAGLNNSIIDSQDAYSIDKKIDDGLAAFGLIFTLDGNDVNAGDCISADEYNISKTNPDCYMLFYLK